MPNPIAHNLARGFYLLDPTTGVVIGGPYGSRNRAACEHSNTDQGSGPYVILEVIGDVVPWLGAAVGNVCLDADTAAASYEDRIDNGDHLTESPQCA